MNSPARSAVAISALFVLCCCLFSTAGFADTLSTSNWSTAGPSPVTVTNSGTGGLDFSNYFLPLSSKVTASTLIEAKKQGAVLAWGNFLTIVINFIIIAFVLFLAIRAIGRMVNKEAEKAPVVSKQEQLLTEIRDLLKQR